MKKIGKWLKRLFFGIFIFHLFYLLFCWVFNPPITCTQLGSLLRGEGLRRHQIALSSMSANARLAVMASEDQLFPDHNGFDWKSIEKAMAYNKRKPGRVRGASTISQQVAKNTFLWQGGGWFRKGLEVYFTFMIELLYSKRRIMELYLNVAEMGKGIYGIEAAAQAYFKKPASKLTANEAAQIAACLPNPVKYTVQPMSNLVRKRVPGILQQMRNLAGDPDIQAILK